MTVRTQNEFGSNWPTGRPAGLEDDFGLSPDDHVLEVGGGGNAWDRAQVVCDLTFGSSAQRNGAPAVLHPGKRYVEAAVESLPFRDHEFDFVYCTQVLEHVQDPSRAAAELTRVARRGFVEVPSRFGELTHGNPTHRWIIDAEGGTLVFHARPFIEHPLHSFYYGLLFKDPEFRALAEGRYRNVFNHQLLWEGQLTVRIADAPGETRCDLENPEHALRAHWSFARDTLAAGAPASYAFPELLEARRRAPAAAGLRQLHAVYLARQARFGEALELLPLPSEPFEVALRTQIERARTGALDVCDVPIPTYDPALISALRPGLRPLVSVLVAAQSALAARASATSALTQDYPEVEVLWVELPGQKDALAGLEFGARLQRIRAASLLGGLNQAALQARGEYVAFVIEGDRLLTHHLALAVGELQQHSAEAVHTRALYADGSGSTRASLSSEDPRASTVPLSTLVAKRTQLAGIGLLPELAGDSAIPGWLRRLAQSGVVRTLEAATVQLATGAPLPQDVLRGRELLPGLDPMELWREVVAGAGRVRGLEARIQELEAALRDRETP